MSKNPKLAYEANEPAFLSKLRGQYGSSEGRLERPAMRPRKAKDPKDEEDDEPVYVDEESNEVISKEEYKALVKGDDPTDDTSTADNKDESKPQSDTAASKQSNLTEIGGQKKRKQAKVVGEDNKPEPEETQPKETQPKTAAARKPKKAKKIKLSFDEE